MPKTMIMGSMATSGVFFKVFLRGDFLKQAHIGESWVTKRQVSPL